jgi:hypothetical protein
MVEAHIIQVNGAFVGGALTAQGGFRFRAIHPSVDDLDDRTWSSLAALQSGVEQFFTTGRLSPPNGPTPGQ